MHADVLQIYKRLIVLLELQTLVSLMLSVTLAFWRSIFLRHTNTLIYLLTCSSTVTVHSSLKVNNLSFRHASFRL